jgi:hypothetical protein
MSHVEYRIFPAGFLEAGSPESREFVDVAKGHLCLADPDFMRETVSLPQLDGDQNVGPQPLDRLAFKFNWELEELVEEEAYDPEADCELLLTIVVHEEGRNRYADFPQMLWGREWYGPVAVRALYVEPGSGIEFHADVTEEMLASIPARLEERDRRTFSWMARAVAEGAEVMFM